MSEQTFPIRVYYEDTDAGGVVYYANYLKFLERARTEWLRALGADQTRLAHEHRVQFVVHSLSIDYRRPARLDDLLAVRSRVAKLTRASLTFDQQVQRQTEPTEPSGQTSVETLVHASVRICCVSTDTLAAAPLPDHLHTLLAQHLIA